MNYKKRTVLEVLDHHIKYLGEGNLEETLKDYNEGSFIITPHGVVEGLSEIRSFFRNSIDKVLPPESRMEFSVKTVKGDVAYIVWSADSPFGRFPIGSDTFLIQNGEIISQTFAGIFEEAR